MFIWVNEDWDEKVFWRGLVCGFFQLVEKATGFLSKTPKDIIP
jgi:hypothetical protein